MEKKKFYIRMTAALLLVTVGLLAAFGIRTSAANAINTSNSRFQRLTGDAAYLNYADNYYIDIEDLGLLNGWEKAVNNVCNFLFKIISTVGQMSATLYYYCMDFDLSELFRDQISEIQKTLRSGLFQPLFILAFCGAAVHMLKKLLFRDLMGAYGQVLKVVGILVLSVLVVRDSSTALSAATGITKAASAQILSGMQGGESQSVEDYAASAAGTLWVSLVHQPWIFIEFWNDTPTQEEIEKLLRNEEYSVGSEKREELVKSHQGSAFKKELAYGKAGFLMVLLIPHLIKCVIYIIMGILMMVFQLLAIFYVLLAPIVLLLAMIPGYESLLGAWLKKLLETQLGVLVMSFIMGLLIKIDALLFTQLSAVWGWLVVLVVEAVLDVFIILKRDELFGLISKLQRTASNPGYARAMIQHAEGGAGILKSGRVLQKGASLLMMNPARATKDIVQKGAFLAAKAGAPTKEEAMRNVASTAQTAAAPPQRRGAVPAAKEGKEDVQEAAKGVAHRSGGPEVRAAESRPAQGTEKGKGVERPVFPKAPAPEREVKPVEHTVGKAAKSTDSGRAQSVDPEKMQRPRLQNRVYEPRQKPISYAGAPGDGSAAPSVAPSEAHMEVIRPQLKEWRENAEKGKEEPSETSNGRPQLKEAVPPEEKAVKRPVRDKKAAEEQRERKEKKEVPAPARHPKSTARERQREEQTARQKVQVERPRYQTPGGKR